MQENVLKSERMVVGEIQRRLSAQVLTLGITYGKTNLLMCKKIYIYMLNIL